MKYIMALEMRKMSHRGRRMQIFGLLSTTYRVIYVAPMSNLLYWWRAGNRDWKSIFNFHFREINENFTYVEMPIIFLPFQNMLRFINRINNLILSQTVRAIRRKLKIKSVNYWWVGYPFAVDYVVNKPTVIYDCFDDHLGWKGFYSRKVVGQIERDLLNKASLTIFSSQELVRKKSDHCNHYRLIRNAADYDHFYLSPNESLIHSKIVIYVGVISDWCELDLLESVATDLPDYQFWFVGPVRKNYLDNIKERENVKLFGLQPYESLMEYIRQASVCIIPFDPMHEVIKSTNPIKMYEYFAAGKPVVSTNIEEVRKYGDVVYLAHSAREFTEMIPRAIEENSLEKIEARQKVAEENTWTSRVAEIESELEKL